MTVSTVCDACNEWAGREIDQPFLADDLLKEYRSIVDQRDPRRGRNSRRPPSPLLRGHTPDGDYVAYDHELGRPVVKPRIVDLGDGRFQVRAGSDEDAERLIERLTKRAALEGKELKLETREEREDRPQIEGRVMIRTDVWRREAAKIGLAVASAVYPASWRRSADAGRLREWLHDRDVSTPTGKAPPLVPTRPPEGFSLGLDDEHVLFFQRFGDGATCLTVMLFGVACFAVPVDTTGQPIPKQAWRLDWRQPRRGGATTWDELLMEAVLRIAGDDPDDHDEDVARHRT